VPDVSIKSRCHELVFRVDGEVKGEELPELVETAHADEHPERNQHDSKEERGSQ
jgi:hypothetical protein